MTYPCPFCSVPASAATGCPSCGRGPDRDALAVVRADTEIAELSTRLRDAWDRRHQAASRVRATVATATSPTHAFPPAGSLNAASGPAGSEHAASRPAGSGHAASGPAGSGHAASGPPREASTRLVQNALFLLGGLLLGVAAIVFTAVAWAQFGVSGRAALLALGTAAALAVPFAARSRGLIAAAETFAAVGLLLCLLDGYAAWSVNLFGVADGSALGYAGAVCAVTAAVAASYEHVTGLTGPRYAALLISQPVVPLLAATAHPGPTGWSLTLAVVVAANLALFGGRRTGLGIAAVVCAAVAGTGAALAALAVGSAAGLIALTAVALVTAAAATRRPRLRPAALALLVIPVPAVLAHVAAAAVRTLDAAGPLLAAPLTVAVPSSGRWLPVAAVLLTGAAVVTLPARWRRDAALAGGALLAWSLPSALGLPWWTAPILNLAVVVLALRWHRLLIAAPLVLHAVAVGLGRPVVANGVLVAVAALGVATALAARSRELRPREIEPEAASPAAVAGPSASWSAASPASTAAASPASWSAASPASTGAAGPVGWVTAAAAVVGLALVGGHTLGFDPFGTAFLVLGAATAIAAFAWVGLAGHPAERRPVEAAAHLAAVVALALTASSAGHAAVVCTFWGLVLGVRALQQSTWRAYLVAAAATEFVAWALLLVAADVAMLEAYTIPAAAVALLAGLLARRGRQLSSWATHGPALAAGLLPSLASILAVDGQHLRRLLLGIAALAVVVAGAQFRLRAPVLFGGAVLALIGLQEIGRVWDLVPRWIPLAAGGLLLVVLAVSLERRRRDLDRFRAALRRMS